MDVSQEWLRFLTVLTGVLGAMVAVGAGVGKWRGWLGESAVTKAHYIAYGLMSLSILLFVLRGCAGIP